MSNLQKPIQSLQRAIDILNCFDEHTPLLSLSEISRITGLNINTARGLVNTLVANNMLRLNSRSNKYSLGYYFVIKGKLAHHREDEILGFCKPAMLRVADKYHVTCSLQLVNNNDVFTIFSCHAADAAYRIYTSQYINLPFHATSSGKLLLYYNILEQQPQQIDEINISKLDSFTPYTISSLEDLKVRMENIAACGYADEQEEYELGLGGLAVPILDTTGRLISTISITAFINTYRTHRDSILTDLKFIADSLMSYLNS